MCPLTYPAELCRVSGGVSQSRLRVIGGIYSGLVVADTIPGSGPNYTGLGLDSIDLALGVFPFPVPSSPFFFFLSSSFPFSPLPPPFLRWRPYSPDKDRGKDG